MKPIHISLPLGDNDAFELLQALRDGHALPESLCSALADYVEELIQERDAARDRRAA